MNVKSQLHPARVGLDDRSLDEDMTFAGKLDGIAHEVQQNLPQATKIAAVEFGRNWNNTREQIKFLLVSVNCEHLRGFKNDVGQTKLNAFQFQFAGFDLRQIQNFI